MKILFLISSLRGGGAERVASTLCNYWCNHGDQVVLVTLDQKVNDFYISDEKIVRYELNAYKSSRNIFDKIYGNLTRLFKLRKIIKQERPNVVVAFLPVPNILGTLSCLFTGIPVVISERCYPPFFNHNDVLDRVRKIVYKFSKAFVAQTQMIADWGKDFLHTQNVTVIANPISGKAICNSIDAVKEKIVFAMGRLDHQKGFDVLINAFKEAQVNFPEWKLYIAGEGEERVALEKQITECALQDKIILMGQINNPEEIYAKASLFVLSSRAEGFPNVLVEAMANGLPVVSCNCPTGPAEIIDNGINGLLVPTDDAQALSNAIQSCIADPHLREQMSLQAIKVRDKYKIDNISLQWKNLFTEIAG